MKAQIEWGNKQLETNLAQPISISIPIKNGTQNPNCYFADPVKIEIIKGDGFVGSVKLGGSVNHQKLTISPHGNGTHTECYGHITDSNALIATQLKNYLHVAQLISVKPLASGEDLILDNSIIKSASLFKGINALIVRTLPNNNLKLEQNYSGTNPIYFSKEAMEVIVDHGIEHLVTDLPSVDKELDDGRLIAHKTFWQIDKNLRPHATITELAFMANNIEDGLYLLDLQILALHLDVSPSNPILYSLSTITK